MYKRDKEVTYSNITALMSLVEASLSEHGGTATRRRDRFH